MEGCIGCKHHIGAGMCRINLERECGDGGREAYEPRETREYTEAEFIDAAVSCYWAGEAEAIAYVQEHKKGIYTDADLTRLHAWTREECTAHAAKRHRIFSGGAGLVRSTKIYREGGNG